MLVLYRYSGVVITHCEICDTIGDEGGVKNTTMTTIRSLQGFCMESESITAYLEYVQLFMRANSVEDCKKVVVLLSVVGGKTYNLLRSLLTPATPGDKSYKDIVKVLKEHFEPKPSIIVERFHFQQRTQVPGESVVDYVAELKCLATCCEFGDHLDSGSVVTTRSLSIQSWILISILFHARRRFLLPSWGPEVYDLGPVTSLPAGAVGRVSDHDH